jgi:hypothetical protein
MEKIEIELLQLIEQQKQNLLKIGRQIVTTLTPEDILQPFDYPELENNPLFRYEEGILAGMMSALYTFYASKS